MGTENVETQTTFRSLTDCRIGNEEIDLISNFLHSFLDNHSEVEEPHIEPDKGDVMRPILQDINRDKENYDAFVQVDVRGSRYDYSKKDTGTFSENSYTVVRKEKKEEKDEVYINLDTDLGNFLILVEFYENKPF